MIRKLLILLLATLSSFAVNAISLRYAADYRYGFIKITAGFAEIDVDIDDNTLTATLNGHSIPWHGREYTISDTIVANMSQSGGVYNESVQSESGWYSKPRIAQIANGEFDRDNMDNYRTIYGRGYLDASDETMEAVTISADMLAMFYYFNVLNFGDMSARQNVTINIVLPDGDTQQALITYNGTDSFNGNDVYNVTFEYSYHGQMSNYPVDCMVDVNSRLPLMLSAELKIGHIELRLT